MKVEDLGGTYLMSGVHAVFTFVSSLECHGGIPAKVQMIVVQNSPLECILNFHSTVVMNVITHKAAYCLFAWMTLEERRGVVVEDRRTRQEAALVNMRREASISFRTMD
ncbi:hypothetical protein BD410DRAFT_168231 [Rickenella mellea]|uniref:Uncharacterized protein n=1 Tax=Rickenella mellea TaxID=50990 RepID=A0A4Y7PIS0_9AGAM|nr:hypothetical protein BD410DRAFT_168231 [Rickenella mellea]